MIECIVEFEANRTSGSDSDGLGGGCGADVAADVVRGDGGDRGVAEGQTNGSRGGGATSNQGIPDVVGRNGLREDRKADPRQKLHCEREFVEGFGLIV